jgi:hypothetical protein
MISSNERQILIGPGQENSLTAMIDYPSRIVFSIQFATLRAQSLQFFSRISDQNKGLLSEEDPS